VVDEELVERADKRFDVIDEELSERDNAIMTRQSVKELKMRF
jgi:hypothetical protein